MTAPGIRLLMAAGGGGGGGGGTPAGVDATLWLEAQLITGLVNDDPVSTWEDQSGNDHDYFQTSTARPTYKTSQVNGLPALRFDGTSDHMTPSTSPADNFATGWTEGEVIIVLKSASDPSATSPKDGGPISAGTSTNSNHYPFTSGVIYEGFGTSTRQEVGNPALNLATWHIYNVRMSSAGVMTVYLNNTLFYTSGTIPVSFLAAPVIARWSGATSRFFEGDIALVVLNSAVFSSTDRDAILDYISTEYGL